MNGGWQMVVQRPAEDVFDFLADIRNEHSWNPRVLRLEKMSDGPIGPGTRYRGQYQALGLLDTELIECDRPNRLSFRSSGPRMRLTGTFTVTTVPTGTRVSLTAEMLPQGLFRFLAPLMSPLVKRQNAAAAERLKRTLETRAGR